MSTWKTLRDRWHAPWRGGRPTADGWPTLVPPTVPPSGPPRWTDEPARAADDGYADDNDPAGRPTDDTR